MMLALAVSLGLVFGSIAGPLLDAGFGAGGISVDHEIYFAHLGGKGGPPGAKTLDKLAILIGIFALDDQVRHLERRISYLEERLKEHKIPYEED